MTPQPAPASQAPWWQTFLITLANIGLGILTQHFFGPAAGAAAMAAGTAVAHALPSPAQQGGK